MGPEEHAERKRLFEQALRLDPSSVYRYDWTCRRTGSLAEHRDRRRGELERAAKLLADAAAINPNDPHVLDATAFLLLGKGRYNEAISALSASPGRLSER